MIMLIFRVIKTKHSDKCQTAAKNQQKLEIHFFNWSKKYRKM